MLGCRQAEYKKIGLEKGGTSSYEVEEGLHAIYSETPGTAIVRPNCALSQKLTQAWHRKQNFFVLRKRAMIPR